WGAECDGDPDEIEAGSQPGAGQAETRIILPTGRAPVSGGTNLDGPAAAFVVGGHDGIDDPQHPAVLDHCGGRFRDSGDVLHDRGREDEGHWDPQSTGCFAAWGDGDLPGLWIVAGCG